MFAKFGREAALRIFPHNFRKIRAGSSFQDIFPQCSDNYSGGKRLLGFFPTMFGQFGREAAFLEVKGILRNEGTPTRVLFGCLPS